MNFILAVISFLTLILPFIIANPNQNPNQGSPYWSGFRVRYGTDLTQSYYKYPKTVREALSCGFVPLGSGCQMNSCYLGNRYIRNNDNGILLLFDGQGYIAGVQSRIPVDPTKYYPPSYLIPHPFVREDNYWVTNVYFINPGRICQGRTRQQFIDEGIGDAFYMQNGSNPLTDIIYVPKYQSQFNNPNFNKIGCLAMMGVHYGGYEIRKDLNCDTLFPLLPIYYKEILTAFDWAYLPVYDSPIFERLIPAKAYAELIGPKPQCLLNMGDANITTLHVYMIDNPQDIVCDDTIS